MDVASRAAKNSLAGCFCPAGRKAPGRSCSHPPAYVSLTFAQKKTASVSLHQRFFHGAKQTSVYKGYKQDKIEMRGDRAEMSDLMCQYLFFVLRPPQFGFALGNLLIEFFQLFIHHGSPPSWGAACKCGSVLPRPGAPEGSVRRPPILSRNA